MLLCIPLFPWILIIGFEFMMTPQKIKTEDHDWDNKKNSLRNLATHGKVLFLLPPNNFLTKKNEISSISYASFEATGIVHVIPLSLRYWGPSSVYRRGYIDLENGITLNYQNQWLNIYSYDYFILSDHLVLSNDLRGHTLRPRQTELSSSLYLIHYDEANIEITVADTDDMKAPQVYIAWQKWGLVSCEHFWNSVCVASH